MQHDSHAAIVFFDKRPGLVNAGDAARGIGEDHIDHGGGRRPIQLNHLVHNLARAPGLDGETLVLGEFGIVAHKVGEGTFTISAKGLCARGQGWFGGHWPVLIAIGLVYHFCGGFLGFGDPALGVVRADLQQGRAPTFLGLEHLGEGDVVVQDLDGRGG